MNTELSFHAHVTENGYLLVAYSLGNFDGYHTVSEEGDFYQELGTFETVADLNEYMSARGLTVDWN